uniref:Uncharacterized protein n=1 Tax=Arundo donax TaxID=35708 RepID=A0A0A9EAC8_ARUDO
MRLFYRDKYRCKALVKTSPSAAKPEQ